MLRELEKCNIEGFENLSFEHKELYREFIMRFILGFESKIEPIAISYVQERAYSFLDECDYCGIGIEMYDLHDGKLIFCNIDEAEKLKADKCTIKKYLRFDYRINEYNEWLHVVKTNNKLEWY